MTSSLAASLAQIAADSTDSLNLKAQKAAHSKSLIFEPRVAASQSLDTLYTLCHEGFQELCLLDGRFLEFQRDIFSQQSQEEDRTMMTKEEISGLDKRIELFLGLVGGRLRLNPAIKAVEWLIRRFRIHEYNTSFLLTTFLPYHTLPIFTTLLSILPSDIPQSYRFLHPFVRSLILPPRNVIVQAATNNNSFISTLNTYVLQISKSRHHYSALLAFWAGVMTEATSGMLDKSRSGRKGVQQQNEQDIILKLLPTLNEGLSMKKVPDLRVGCYMLLSILASKGGLDDKLLTAMMEAVVLGWTTETILPGLVCLSVLAQYRGLKQITKRLTKELLKVPNLPELLIELSKQRRIDKLANGLCLALVDRLGKTGDVNGLPVIEQIVQNQLLGDAQATVIIEALLLKANQSDSSTEALRNSLPYLSNSLVTLAQLPGHVGSVIQGALRNTEVDMDELELKLHTTMRRKEFTATESEDIIMEDSKSTAISNAPPFLDLLRQLPKRTINEVSFLSPMPSHIYSDLCRAFLTSTTNSTDLDLFDEAPILRRHSALGDTLYLSFYARTWCGSNPVMARASALQMASRCLSDNTTLDVDVQALIPYSIAALSDPATKVRRAAAELIMQMDKCYPENLESEKNVRLTRWAVNDIYGSGEATQRIKWLSSDIACRLVREMLLPALEECVLDKKHIESVFGSSMNSSRNSTEITKKQDLGRLSQASRISILSFLASHVVQTPLFSVKMRLLESLNQIRSISGSSRTKYLLPVLEQLVSLSPSVALQHFEAEKIAPAEYDDQAVKTVTSNDKDGVQFLLSLIKKDVAISRPKLLGAIYGRLRTLWPSLKGELLLKTAQSLLKLSQLSPEDTNYHEIISAESASLLRTVSLSTDILLSFVTQLPTTAKLVDRPPATKRRRTSHGEVARSPLQDSKQLSAAIREVTFVLQLVDSSDPATHPELLKDLFNILAELQHYKAQVASELAYLQGLVLASLLAILRAYKSDPKIKLDPSAIRADLLVDCVQKTASPQVQNSALLLIACLAAAAPELVLHSVMPIFTFVGSSVLRQNDEYSAHVISQTIHEVIPPLVSSLRKDKGNPVTGAAELLLSFVAAYEHVPLHRQKGLFTSLVQTLGAEEFLFAILAMLVDKYGVTESITSFAIDLAGSFAVEIQLNSAVKYLELINDLLKPKPTFSGILLGVSEESVLDPPHIAQNELTLLSHLLSQRRLAVQTAKLLDRDDMDAARVREIYSTLLENILALADTVNDQKRLHNACGDVLESLLGLLSTSEFVKSVEGLLDRPNEALRRKILRSLEVRIGQESPSDATSRVAMLGFLPQLTAIIRESTDVLYKHTAVACVDKISEKYGKKDLEAVAAAAETIASNHCLGQPDDRLRVMALLCLASLTEILREGIVSVLPSAIPKTLEYMEASVSNDDDETRKLHNAGYAFISSLIHYLPYMMSGSHLDKLLTISNISAEADLDDKSDENRVQCLQLAAKQIDAKSMFAALDQNWIKAVAAGESAIEEYIGVLSTAIEKHPKTVITKHSATLAKIFQNAFDLRRQWAVNTENPEKNESISEIEAELNDVAIKMIYKFNDATFRPIFSGLVEWAGSLPKKDEIGKIQRLQTLYGFATVFFDNLKSIVTSYATYILEITVDVLKNINLEDDESKELWTRVLQTLTKCFEHDQDDFWQSPSHYNAVAPVLTAQFTQSSALLLAKGLIPAIVELAAAADSSDHHKELNAAILKHMRSETTSVRLTAVKCEQALTDRLGEEWLSMLPEMLPFISELQEDDDDVVEKETHRWIVKIEGILGESLDSMLQ